ncbi:hypothetical protein ACFV4X_37335 [Streptomyces ardesiacus]|uniref:hypothetical protein n=1 Tax=Streptomyces ardesiacus TaxID=285564 RepID=UPI0036559C2E
MVSSAVLPGAALRVLRTAAGRRALYGALLLGGLCVLGLLCGGRAQAADGAPGPSTDTVGRVLDAPSRLRGPQDTRSVQAAGTGPGADSGTVPVDLRPVSGDAVRTVADRVVRPVGDVVETVTEGLEAVAGTVGPAEVPPLRVLPGPSGIDVGDTSGRSGPAAPGPRPAAEPASPPAAPDVSGTADPPRTADARVVEGAGTPALTVTYGPEPAPGQALTAPTAPTAPAATADEHRAAPGYTAPTAHAPAGSARPAPTGDPDGALGTASGADQATPRHGDARAVGPPFGITFRLVPGAPERTEAAGVREPYQDIPVSPA